MSQARAAAIDSQYLNGHHRRHEAPVARALVAFAFGSGRVRVVRAHTYEPANNSARVLLKCGFLARGEVVEPEDGLVWRWEKLPGNIT